MESRMFSTALDRFNPYPEPDSYSLPILYEMVASEVR